MNPGSWQYLKENSFSPKDWQALSDQYGGIAIYRVPVTQNPAKEGDFCGLYVGSEREGMSDVEVFGYYRGAWRRLFNEGNVVYDWTRYVKEHEAKMRESLQEE